MGRIATWLAATVAVVALLFSYRTSTIGAPPSAAARHRTTAAVAASALLRNDPSQTVNGPTIDTRWGPVQVAVTVAGGKITDVQAVQSPSENGKDQEITAYAVPLLHDEAISAQSAQIDTVSGASYTSDGYRRSLQGALDRLASATATTTATTATPPPATTPQPPVTAPATTVTTRPRLQEIGTGRIDGAQIDTRWARFRSPARSASAGS